MAEKATTKFRELLNGQRIAVAVAAWDCTSAQLVQNAGFDLVDAGSGYFEGSQTGSPDAELGTSTEREMMVSNMADAVDIPIFLDLDTGLGHPVQMMRTIRKLEKAGAAGIYLDDQVIPKGCGHWQGRQAIPLEELEMKMRAITDARTDPNFIIIAKVNSLSREGVDATVERAKLCEKWGADVIFVEAMRSVEELQLFPKKLKKTLVNVVEGGRTPVLTIEEYQAMGYSIVKYCGAYLAALNATKDYLDVLKKERSSARLMTKGSTYSIATGFDFLWNLTNKGKFDEYYMKYYPNYVAAMKDNQEKK